MKFGICPLSVVPIRSNSTNKSEMVSQLLFGELVEILESKGRQWSKIRCQWDNFVGWVSSSQLKAITPSEFEDFQTNYAYSLELMQPVMGNKQYIPITLAARLPNFDGIRFMLGDEAFTFSGQAVFPKDIAPGAEFILKIARKYINAPFLWGGRSPFGLDSAGFTQVVYKMAGIKLPREAGEQVYVGEAVDFAEQARPGDLAFFENRNNRIHHVGIILPEQQIIHAYGNVRIDKLDHYGIYNEEETRYTHKLRVIKRVLPPGQQGQLPQEEKQTSNPNQVELFKSL